MLETRDLLKIYKPKKGVPVKALDGVSLRLPDKGMVFLLGKSGSGKSTLLNVLGGLDKYDGGEITIKGVSSKNFKQKHFDSYRNTYVGFIFQEYNVLDEFNVGANIALAIELQGRKASDDEINRILHEVDLDGFGARKPNELSGGQKQRVAIARALVKNPQIIMADEPTGALDSNTGRQVLETLKSLSSEKLVIVVSHDREFAENYADRIIELADGKVISDVERSTEIFSESKKELSFEGDKITVPSGYHLTEEDRLAINDYIESLKSGEVSINIAKKGSTLSGFVPTDVNKIKHLATDKFNLIKSKLPLKNAFKMGGSALKHKKFRLVLTIILSCIAFALFGLADTFSAYNHVKTCTNSIYDTGIDYAAVRKAQKIKYNGSKNYHWREYGYKLSNSELTKITENTGVKLRGVFVPRDSYLSFEENIAPGEALKETEYNMYSANFEGFTEISEEIINELGYKMVAGRLPDGTKDEILISKYVYEIFKRGNYTDGTLVKNQKGEDILKTYEINSYVDILEKTISINGKKYMITGVLDTGLELERYSKLEEESENLSTADKMIKYALYNEFLALRSNSLASLIMVGNGKLDTLISAEAPIYDISKGYIWFNGNTFGVDPQYLTTLSDLSGQDILWLNGVRSTLGDKEIVIHESLIQNYGEDSIPFKDDGTPDYAEFFKKDNSLTLNGDIWNMDDMMTEDGFSVVGIIRDSEKTKGFRSTAAVSERIFNIFCDKSEGDYDRAIGSMPKDKEDIGRLVAYCYNEDGSTRFPLQNAVTFELDMVNEFLKEAADIFLYIGLGFAVFAGLMLANFIGTSISYKKQEIGILRAIGSRSNDVFRIFFAESFIIAMINFVLSSALVIAAIEAINYVVRYEAGILITVLKFGARQGLLLIAVSILVAFIASFLPVKKIASKRPIDAIRDR